MYRVQGFGVVGFGVGRGGGGLAVCTSIRKTFVYKAQASLNLTPSTIYDDLHTMCTLYYTHIYIYIDIEMLHTNPPPPQKKKKKN